MKKIPCLTAKIELNLEEITTMQVLVYIFSKTQNDSIISNRLRHISDVLEKAKEKIDF